MMQSWMGERMAMEHRRDLVTLIRAEKRSPSDQGADLALTAPERLAQSRSTAGRGVANRPIGRQIGALLIRVGTRLGGASISAS